METGTTEPTWDVLVRLVGRRVVVASADGRGEVPLTVADVTDAVTCDGWTTFTATLVGTSDGRLVAPGRYDVTVDDSRFGMTLTWIRRGRTHQHYQATFIQPVPEANPPGRCAGGTTRAVS
ncbi:DUF6916 family protein [Nocardioides sp.]|uniref:DUF6916 family protein n=1 Tax=Nocardioides sp. TaxID=35761 RepID=UPI002ED27B77